VDEFVLYSLTAAVLFVLGLLGVVLRRDLFRKIVSLNVLSGAVFLFLVATAHRNATDSGPDPVPQAMVLTGIVVAVSVSAFALVLVRRIHSEGEP
jgi:multicomponent Na+:H+ antiporter subunit C